MLHAAVLDRRRNAADVVGMQMGYRHIVRLGDAEQVEIIRDGMSLVRVTGIEKQRMTVRKDEDAVSLPHVDHMDLERRVRPDD